MPGRAQSITKKRLIQNKESERWMLRAIELYSAEKNGDRKLSLRSVIKIVEKECMEKTGKQVKIDKTTLGRRVSGARSIQAFNAQKREKATPKPSLDESEDDSGDEEEQDAQLDDEDMDCEEED